MATWTPAPIIMYLFVSLLSLLALSSYGEVQTASKCFVNRTPVLEFGMHFYTSINLTCDTGSLITLGTRSVGFSNSKEDCRVKEAILCVLVTLYSDQDNCNGKQKCKVEFAVLVGSCPLLKNKTVSAEITFECVSTASSSVISSSTVSSTAVQSTDKTQPAAGTSETTTTTTISTFNTSQTKETGQGNTFSTYLVVIGALCGVVVIFIIVTISLCIVMKRVKGQNHTPPSPENPETPNAANQEYIDYEAPDTVRNNIDDVIYEEASTSAR